MSRSILTHMLDQTATHQRATFTADASGGRSPSWATVAASVPCAVWPVAAETVEQYARQDIVVTHQIATDRDLGAKREDRITIGSTNYLVRGVNSFTHSFIPGSPVYVLDVELRIL